jgi:hypothetical protein
MNRSNAFAAVALAALLSLVGLVAIGPAHADTSAQDATTQGHPLVGTWLVDNDPAVENNLPENITFTSDGALVDVQGSESALGVWAATGATTATVTFSEYQGDDSGGFAGGYMVRASVEVSADGNSFTGQYTIEVLNPDGTMTGQAGPGAVTATRVMAEAPGTPVMTIDELFGPSGEGTPEASPVN